MLLLRALLQQTNNLNKAKIASSDTAADIEATNKPMKSNVNLKYSALFSDLPNGLKASPV